MKTKSFFVAFSRKAAVLLQPALYHSFLQNLKWLDLKDNPLDPVLAKVAGDCLDEKQCKQAAVKVRDLLLVSFSSLALWVVVVLPLFTQQAGQLLQQFEGPSGSEAPLHCTDIAASVPVESRHWAERGSLPLVELRED